MAAGRPTTGSSSAYIANGCFWQFDLPPEEQYFKPVNRAYLARSRELGLIDTAAPITLHLYAEMLQRFRLAAEGHGAVQPPESHRERIRRHFDPLPFWYQPFEHAAFADGRLSAARDHPAADADVPQLGLAERLAAPDPWPGIFSTCIAGPRRALGLADDDWVEVTSPHGAIKAQLRLMDGCRPRYGLDLERDRQAGRRLVAGGRRAGGGARLSDQSRHWRAFCPRRRGYR